MRAGDESFGAGAVLSVPGRGWWLELGWQWAQKEVESSRRSQIHTGCRTDGICQVRDRRASTATPGWGLKHDGWAGRPLKGQITGRPVCV